MIPPTITGTAGDKVVELSCTAVAGAVKYRFLRGLTATSLSTIGSRQTARTYKDTAVENGTPYWYSVRGIDSQGKAGPDATPIQLTPSASFELPKIGFGKGVTGGGSAIPQKVSTVAQYIEALHDTGARHIYGDGQWLVGAGQTETVDPQSRDLTVRNIATRQLHVRIKADNTAWLNGYSWPYEPVDAPGDVDGFTANGQGGETIEGLLIDHWWGAFGVDMAGLAILGEVFDWTIMRSVWGPGLVQSSHPESPKHNRTVNFTTFGEHADGPWGKRGSFYQNLILGGDHRNPDVKYVEGIDLIENLIYNQGPRSWRGNPRGMNGVNNIVRRGPQTTALEIWRGIVKTDENELPFPNSVYLAGNVADGFPEKITYLPGTKRDTPFGGGLSVATSGPPDMAALLAMVGPSYRNAFAQKLLDYVTTRTSEGYYNGVGYPGPHPVFAANPAA